MIEHPESGAIRDYRSQMPIDKFQSLVKDVYNGNINETSYSFRLRQCISEIETFKESYKERVSKDDYISGLRTKIKKEIGDVIFLYLPTYRRIEQEAKTIFGKPYVSLTHNTIDNYEEYVEFGMGDVMRVFEDKTKELKNLFDTNNNKIKQNNLLDILNHQYEKIEIDNIKNLTQDDINKVIATISTDEKYNTQQVQEIQIIIDKVNKLGQKAVEKDVRSQILCHIFLGYLASINELEDKAKIINKFTKECNQYLINKELFYSDKDFSIKVVLKDIELQNDTKRQIGLSSLSSGEKQIVSLFCKLYLQDDGKQYFVLIDEPELSISVGWQKRFLIDVINSKKCVGLFAVTHSPFIYKDNELENYALDSDDMEVMEKEDH